jgi:hypothetical protein
MNDKAIGGSDVCHTCAAHCVALEDAAARIAQLEAALKACFPALDIAMEQAHPRQRDHWHKIIVQASEALTPAETKGEQG